MRLSSVSYLFGPHTIHSSQVFYESALSIGFVNIKPIVPGHILVIPKRVERRVMDLTTDEYVDLFASVRFIAPRLEKHYEAQALNIAIQDGVESGQSVPHVHVHVLPRKTGTFRKAIVLQKMLLLIIIFSTFTARRFS